MWFYAIVVLLVLIYYLFKKHLSFWEDLGVPGPKPLPIVGNIGLNFIGKKTVSEIFKDIYMKYKEYPFVGVYRAASPCLVPIDPELIKNIIVKDFKHFVNNDIYVNKEIDPLFGRNPFVLKDEEWKTSRQQLVPSFSSGKIKAMFPLVEDVSKRLVKYVEDQGATTAEILLDGKELCTKFTCDNVAVCAFGIEGKCFEEPNSEFRHMAEKFVSPNSFQGFKLGLSLIVPKITNLFSMKMVPKYVDDRLIEMVTKSVEYRRQHNVVRNDFLDAISQIQKMSPTFTMVDITGHVSNFFIDGFETSSVTMSFALLQLAMNQKCQIKLREEIFEVLKKNDDVFSYDTIQEMSYLDACVSETLRLHPPLGFLGKTCTERYTIKSTSPDYKPLTVTINPGTSVEIPVLGLHMDPKYFPEPEKFIPERFLDKKNSYKYVYLPFGDGPRICIGQRFGLMQIKVGVVQIIRNFEITVNEKTLLPLRYSPYYWLLFPQGGIWLNLRKAQR